MCKKIVSKMVLCGKRPHIKAWKCDSCFCGCKMFANCHTIKLGPDNYVEIQTRKFESELLKVKQEIKP